MKRMVMIGTLTVLTVWLAGCGSSGGSIAQASDAEGLWKDGSGDAVGMVTAMGITTIVTGLTSDVTAAPLYKGNVVASSTTVTGGTLTELTTGGVSTAYSVTGDTVSAKHSLVIVGEAGADTVTFDLVYDSGYERASSLGYLTGLWGTDATTTMVIDDSGTVTSGYDALTECNITGAFSMIDGGKNLYGVSLMMHNCAAYAEGSSFSGYATLSDADGGTLNSMLLAAGGTVDTATQVPFARVMGKAVTP